MSSYFVCSLCDEQLSLDRMAELDIETYPELQELDPIKSYCGDCITYMEDEIQSERWADAPAMREDT